MPIPKPNKEERQKDFISRCMADQTMIKDYPNTNQRAAVCYQALKDRNKK